jgi:predicted PhzF superfamily epimerase YddE/YHI9
LIEVADAATLLEITPDFALLKTAGKTAFTLISRSNRPDYDLLTRFFAPALGINENPVTGSAFSYLTPYWVEQLGKQTLAVFQASKRGGVIECCLSASDRVLLRGQAATVFEIDALL